MRWLFWLIALFALAAAVALGAHTNDGYVLFIFPPWRMEISLNLFLVALALLIFVAYGILRGVFLTLGMPQRAREYREQSARQKAMRTLQDALRLLFEGRFGQAMRKADEAHATGVVPGLAALIAARASQRLSEPEKQYGWILRARQDDPKCDAAALMLEAEFNLDRRDYAAALVALQRLQIRHGRHLAALRLELRARQGMGEWDEVLRLVRQLEKRDALLPEVAREIRVNAHQSNVRKRAGDAKALLAYQRSVPAGERDARLTLALADELQAAGNDELAAEVIENHIDQGDADHWHTELIQRYGRLAGGEITARIAKAEKWLLNHAGDGVLLLALGRLCLRQRLWGKAQSYLEASLAIKRTPEGHLELARLFDMLEKHDEANRHFRLSVEVTN